MLRGDLSSETATRDLFVTSNDIRRIEVPNFNFYLNYICADALYQRGIEAEAIRLDRNDGPSVLHWVDRMREAGDLLAFKSSADAAPSVERTYPIRDDRVATRAT